MQVLVPFFHVPPSNQDSTHIAHFAMLFLSRRSVDPLTSTTQPRDRAFPPKQSEGPQTLRTRSQSEATLFRRVSTLFTVRRRTLPKALSSPRGASSAGIEYRCTHHRNPLPRFSTDSTTTPQSSLEIRRPSGLGRRASLLGSDNSITDSESFGREIQEGGDTAPIGFASLPNLSSGAFHSERSESCGPHPPQRCTASVSIALPDPIFRLVLEFLPRNELAVVALVSRGFCAAARYALYHALNVQTVPELALEKLYNVLACEQELAALVVALHCHSWPSWEVASTDDCVPCIPSNDVRQALQNMYNLKSLTLPSFASILSLTPSLTFSLTHLTILDKKLTQSQLVVLRSWLTTQPSVESLSFPHLAEYASTDPSFIDEWAPVADPSRTDATLLPSLKSLRASAEIVPMLCHAMNNPIQHLTLDVHGTLYTGLRPSSVIRSLNGVREMHITFAPEVDKRTVEKFLGVTGSMLTGEGKAEAMKSLEVEVSWTDHDAAEVRPQRSIAIVVSLSTLLVVLLRLDAVRDRHLDHIPFPGVEDAQVNVAVSLHPSTRPCPCQLVAGTPLKRGSLTSLDGIVVRFSVNKHCRSPW